MPGAVSGWGRELTLDSTLSTPALIADAAAPNNHSAAGGAFIFSQLYQDATVA